MSDPSGPYLAGPYSNPPADPSQQQWPPPLAPTGATAPGRYPPAPAPPPYAQVQQPYLSGPHDARYRRGTRASTRRRLLTTLVTSLPVFGAAGYLVSRLGSGTASQDGAGGGYNAGNYNPSTLPSAAGAVNNISTADVQALLDKANKALQSGNQQDYVALFTGAAATQAPVRFTNLRKFGFAFAEYQLIQVLTRPFDVGDGVSAEMDIAFVHQVADVDGGKIAEWYRWTMTRSGGRDVVVTKVTGSPSINDSLKYTYYPMPWDSPTDIEVVKQGLVVVCAEATYASAVHQYAGTLAAAVQDNRDEWDSGAGSGGVAPGAFFMLGPANQLFYWFSGAANKAGNEAGETTPCIDPAWLADNSKPYRFTGARIALNLDTTFFTINEGSDSVRSLGKHEDGHNMVATIESAEQDSTPLWVVEGFADFMATHDFPNAVTSYFRNADIRAYVTGSGGVKWSGGFPADDEVYNSSALVSSGSYGLSAMIFYYVHSVQGMRGVVRLLTANYEAAPKSDGAQGLDNVGAAIQSALGISQDALLSGTRGFIKQQLGVAA